MMNLINTFNKMIYDIGLNELQPPIFYNAPVGMRFEIGGEEDVYVKKGILRTLHPNPQYVKEAIERALTIFNSFPQNDWLLRIDVYDQREIGQVCKKLQLGVPQETVKKEYLLEGDEMTHYELYWDLNQMNWSIEKLIKEVVLADIGGLNSLASAVFLLHTKEHILYYLYDDRGLDVVAQDKETLLPLYEKYSNWILDDNRKEIDFLFTENDTIYDLKKMLSFLNKLEKKSIYYKLNKVRDEAIMVEVAVPGQRWEIEFLDDGSVDVEKFISEQDLYDARELEVLLKEFAD